MTQELIKNKNELSDLSNIINLIIKLIEVLEKENNALKVFDFSNFEDFYKQKNSIIETIVEYQTRLKESVNQNDIKLQKETLDNLKIQLKKTSEENMNLLNRSVLINHKIINKITDSYLSEENAIMGYNKAGKFVQKFRTYSEIPAFTVKNYI